MGDLIERPYVGHARPDGSGDHRPKTFEHVLLERAVVIRIEPKPFRRTATEPVPVLSRLVEAVHGYADARSASPGQDCGYVVSERSLTRPIDAVYADEVAPRATESLDVTDESVEQD
jgi:hypothetical protein